MHPLRAFFQRFAPLPDAAWAPMEAVLQSRKLARHAHFIEPGQTRHEIGFLLRGMCRHFYLRPDGEEKTTYFYFEGDALTDYRACVLGQPTALTIEALTPCELLVFPYETMRSLYDQWPAWERVGRRIGEYVLAGLEARMVELLVLSPEDRYRALLAAPHKHKILERVPQQYIAAYLGVTPVSLSRIRARVAAEGEGRFS